MCAMTDNQAPPDPTAPEAPGSAAVETAPGGGFREGIYLEEKKSVIGTGGTAKTAAYRNFWATGIIRENTVVMVLLDDEFKPTGLQETFRREAVTGPGWFFIDQGEKKYQRLRPLLDRILAAPAPAPAPAAPAAPAASGTGNWWGGGAPAGPPKDPFALDKTAKKNTPPAKKGGWWDK
jgi:hypothetical protein